MVVHSATKFLNGHSDAIAGVVAGDFDRVREVQRRVITLGTCLDPHAAYLVWRGLQTFELRIARSNATALRLAAALAERDDVVSVRHPSLPGYERAEVAARVLRRDGDVPRTGGMVTFTVAGGDERALRVMRRLEVGCEATSLGGVETLVSTPFNSSHFSLTPAERRAARIDDGMIRVSCGVEPTELLIEDFLHALDATALTGSGVQQPSTAAVDLLGRRGAADVRGAGVRGRAATPRSRTSAAPPASAAPRCWSISTVDQSMPTGLAIPLPAMSGADPWTGSNIDGVLAGWGRGCPTGRCRCCRRRRPPGR